MKKIAIALFAIFIFAQSYAQNDCQTIPFQPTLGVIDAADTAEWFKFSNLNPGTPAAGPNPSYWNFRPQPGQSNFVPYLSVRNTTIGYVALSSPCISFDTDKTYELNFTFVGLSSGFMNRISVYLVGNTEAFADGANPFTTLSNYRLQFFENIPFGTTDLSLLIRPEHFSQITGSPESYRIVFRSETQTRVSPADGNYTIQGFLTNIALSEAQNHNFEVVAMTSPRSNCDLTNEVLSFAIRNRGFEMPATFSVCFRIGATGTWHCQEFTDADAIAFNEVVELRLDDPNLLQTFSAPLTQIEAQVQVSGQASSNTLLTSLYRTAVETLPYVQTFDNPAFFQTWSIIPGKTAQPNVTWYTPLEGGAMAGRAVIVTSGEASNDRMVSGCIPLVAGTRYQISFTYRALPNPSRLRPGGGGLLTTTDLLLATSENLKLYVGRSNLPSDSDITLMNLRGFNNTDDRTLTVYFTPTESGSHFFGFLANSDALSAGISVSYFSVVEAPEPRALPVFMSFENYDNHDGWQLFSHNTIDSVVTVNVMRGWQLSTEASDRAHGGAVGLRTFSSPALASATNSVITQSEDNNNWLISPPIFMVEGVPVQIRYFRRAMLPIAANLPGEILNIRVSDILEIDSLYRLEPWHRDTVRSNTFTVQNIYYTPTRTGVHFVSFQYNSQNRRTGTNGMSLDEISIQDSALAQERNVSVINLVVPAPACALQAHNVTELWLYVKNRTGQVIPANTLGAHFKITDPSGNTTVVRGNRSSADGAGGTIGANGNFPAIQPYQTTRIGRRFNMTAPGTWEVQAWIAPGTWSGDVFTPATNPIDENPSDDTSAIMQTASTGTHIGRYDMGFEAHENILHWRRSQAGNQRFWWDFINTTTAHTGTGAAFLAPTRTFLSIGDTMQQSIASPCLELSGDTTYFVSFFLRKAEEYNGAYALHPVMINTYASTSPSPLGNPINTTVVDGMEYRQHSFFFRPSNPGTNYIVLSALSPRWSTGVFLDNFVILDSVSATTPNVSLSRIWAVSANTCDLSDDTLYLELVNNGFLEVQDLTFNIQFGGETFSETWYGILPTDTTIIVRLDRRLAHAGFGETTVTVSLDMERNLAQQTSLTTTSVKTEPTRPPFTINFTTAGSVATLGWNNLALPFSELLDPTFEYWSIGGDGAVFRPDHAPNLVNRLHGMLASKCFILPAGEDPHVIIYEFRGSSLTNPENLHVEIERADGTIERIHTNNNILSTNFTSQTLPLDIAGSDERIRVRFFSYYNHLATAIYIRSFSIMAESDVSIADFHTTTGSLLSIHPNPATTEVFIQSEGEISMVFIHDVRGQLVREIRVNSAEYHLNTTDFPAGVYVFTVVIGNAHVSQRIIIND